MVVGGGWMVVGVVVVVGGDGWRWLLELMDGSG